MEKGKIIANRGVARNKKPLQNIRYRIEEKTGPDQVVHYFLLWGYERDLNKRGSWNFHGEVTVDGIKERIGTSGWSKFQQGRRDFTKQRRVDGHNVPPNQMNR